MKIPKGMTQQEIIDQITIVIDRIAPKYTFRDYDVEDIKQEAFMICMDALDRYDSNRPLENFLSVHLSNRLKNFVRDNYFVKGDEDKKKVLAPKQLQQDDQIIQREINTDNILDTQDIKNIIDKFLPVELRSDYLKFLSEAYIPKKRKVYLIQTIQNILKENGYDRS
jgi:RNA polymerase sigma factor (sigma-70 family)